METSLILPLERGPPQWVLYKMVLFKKHVLDLNVLLVLKFLYILVQRFTRGFLQKLILLFLQKFLKSFHQKLLESFSRKSFNRTFINYFRASSQNFAEISSGIASEPFAITLELLEFHQRFIQETFTDFFRNISPEGFFEFSKGFSINSQICFRSSGNSCKQYNRFVTVILSEIPQRIPSNSLPEIPWKFVQRFLPRFRSVIFQEFIRRFQKSRNSDISRSFPGI